MHYLNRHGLTMEPMTTLILSPIAAQPQGSPASQGGRSVLTTRVGGVFPATSRRVALMFDEGDELQTIALRPLPEPED